MRFLLAILLLLPWAGSTLKAQDLTGQWTGTAINSLSDSKQKLILNMSSGDSSFGGVLHWYNPETHSIRHVLVSGRYYGKDSILSVREDSTRPDLVMESGLPGTSGTGTGFSVLYYKRIGHKEVLEGHWIDYGGKGHSTGNLTIRLEKGAPPFIPVVVLTHKKKDSTQTKQFEALLDRQNIVAATIPVHGIDSVQISLYDNGEIDGDSVSLYLNEELLIGHLRLTASPKTLLLPLDKNLPVNKLILFAENLGKLPPNTALMEITINGKIYSLFLSTDYKRNASVEFTLQE